MIDIEKATKENYQHSSAWPDNDPWHKETYDKLYDFVNRTIQDIDENQVILNAGSGGTNYKTQAKIIHLDLIEDYIKSFDNFIVGSITKIPLPNNSVDIIICVGSVINYCDAQKAISEFQRVLKKDGLLILEYERSQSAEFLFQSTYNKELFLKKYIYNNQEHYLWMYNDLFIQQLLKYYNFHINKLEYFHSLSSLLYRFTHSEAKCSKYIKYDPKMKCISRFLAHNCILISYLK